MSPGLVDTDNPVSISSSSDCDITVNTNDGTITALFRRIEHLFKSTSLGSGRWYILALSALVGGGCVEGAADLYLHLVAKPEFTTSASRQQLIRRIREVLVKSVSIIGVCKPLEAIFEIKAVERPEDKDYSFSRKDWASGDANHERGLGWMSKLYKGNLDDTLGLFDDHKDFGWISSDITYGLYLSDHTILDETETQLVVLPGIMIQNLKTETHWHIRGTRRIGVSKKDVEIVYECVKLVAAFLKLDLNRVPKPDQVEHDV
jgi:hypothetical protein